VTIRGYLVTGRYTATFSRFRLAEVFLFESFGGKAVMQKGA
jgi:hypothetical protein